MKWNTEKQRHRILFLERTKFTKKRSDFVSFVFSSKFISLYLCVSVFNKRIHTSFCNSFLVDYRNQIYAIPCTITTRAKSGICTSAANQ